MMKIFASPLVLPFCEILAFVLLQIGDENFGASDDERELTREQQNEIMELSFVVLGALLIALMSYFHDKKKSSEARKVNGTKDTKSDSNPKTKGMNNYSIFYPEGYSELNEVGWMYAEIFEKISDCLGKDRSFLIISPANSDYQVLGFYRQSYLNVPGLEVLQQTGFIKPGELPRNNVIGVLRFTTLIVNEESVEKLSPMLKDKIGNRSCLKLTEQNVFSQTDAVFWENTNESMVMETYVFTDKNILFVFSYRVPLSMVTNGKYDEELPMVTTIIESVKAI